MLAILEIPKLLLIAHFLVTPYSCQKSPNPRLSLSRRVLHADEIALPPPHFNSVTYRPNPQMRADKIRWDAAFTIQAAYRRKRLWRRRAALVHARRAATDAASSTVATDADVAATADKRASSDSKRDRGDNDKNHQTATVTTSPDGDHSDVVTNTVQIPNELGEREAIENYEREVVGEGTIEGVGKGFDVCDADDGTAEQPYEDLGDVVFAAVQSSRRSDYNAMVPPAVLRHASVGTFVDLSQMVSNPTGLPPAFEARLEYYEAKLRYLAAQEAAHGPSAVKIQVSKEGLARAKVAIFRGLGQGCIPAAISRAPLSVFSFSWWITFFSECRLPNFRAKKVKMALKKLHTSQMQCRV